MNEDLLRKVVDQFEIQGVNDRTGTLPVAIIKEIRETLKMPPMPDLKPIPVILQAALIEYDFQLHPDILKKVQTGDLEFQAFDKTNKRLDFEIPELRSKNESAVLHWHGPDSKTWDLGGIRLWAETEYDDGDSQELWSPENVPEEGEEQTPDEHEGNVDDFICWLENKIE